jgi:hypothetical protein
MPFPIVSLDVKISFSEVALRADRLCSRMVVPAYSVAITTGPRNEARKIIHSANSILAHNLAISKIEISHPLFD